MIKNICYALCRVNRYQYMYHCTALEYLTLYFRQTKIHFSYIVVDCPTYNCVLCYECPVLCIVYSVTQ